MKKALSLLLAALLLVGCAGGETPPSDRNTPPDGPIPGQMTPAGTETTGAPAVADPTDLFSDRDRAGNYDAAGAVAVTLAGTTATASGAGVTVQGSTVTVTAEGTYLLTGTLTGMIVVDAPKTDKVQLVLNGVTITSPTSAAIYVRQADKVFLTLPDGSHSSLANGGSFAALDGDESNIDAAIFSRDDLTVNGSGTLQIDSPAGHGIVAKDELTISGASLTLDAGDNGLRANDSIAIADATLQITAKNDAIKAEHDEDAALGFVYIASGSITATADGDGISAGSYVQIDSGTIRLTCGGGHGSVSVSDQGNWGWNNPWGGMMGGGTTTADTVSAKGIKAAGELLIRGGTIEIDAADDALHSNTNLHVAGGTITLSSGDDGLHADGNTRVSGGTLTIKSSYEGIEGNSIDILGGDISLVASDDGLNAAGGADASGFGGFFGGMGGGPGMGGMPPDMGGGRGGKGDGFASGGADAMYVNIAGGRLTVDAGGDGLDSNGSLTVSGGEVYVAGPTNSGNGPLDYTTGATLTGGTLVVAGSSGMAQNFSQAENQGVIMATFTSQKAGTTVTLADEKGTVLLSWESPKTYSSVIVSCPAVVQGGTYTLTAGSYTQTVTVTSLVTGGMGGMGGPGMGGGGRPGGGRGGK
ncbi:MAG: carbohydrate-binding domain-containing protein [Clostridia bacterium]|nr:carbohydrate-binding domain-containing protein [Clostridia bacterium]